MLDTDVVSELRKTQVGKGDARVAAWNLLVEAADLYISVVTVQELEIGVLLMERRDAKQGAALRAWFTEKALPAFTGRIVPVDIPVARRCATLHVPNPRLYQDAAIAATALVHGMVVVTRNAVDFAPMGVKILDPWAQADSGP